MNSVAQFARLIAISIWFDSVGDDLTCKWGRTSNERLASWRRRMASGSFSAPPTDLRDHLLATRQLESPESRKMDSVCLRFIRIFWNSIVAPWKLLFALMPPYQIAHGLIAFILSLAFISGIAYGVTKLTDQISSVTGLSPYVAAFIVLAAGKRTTQMTRLHAKYQYDAATRHLFSPCIQYQHPTLQPGINIRCLL